MGIVRVLLALCVLCSHAGPLVPGTLMTGDLAVMAFFMISGFYVALILDGKYRGPSARWAFWSNRYLRLWPTYLVVVLGYWMLFGLECLHKARIPQRSWMELYEQLPLLAKGLTALSNWTLWGQDFLCLWRFAPETGFALNQTTLIRNPSEPGLWMACANTLPVAWSLGTELFFYLLAPWLWSLRTRWLVGIALVGLLLRRAAAAGGMMVYFFAPAQLHLFILGMLAFRLSRQAWWPKTPGALMTGLVAAAIVLYPQLIKVSPWAPPFLAMAFALAMPSIFTASCHQPVDRWLGNLSYPIYLIHDVAIRHVKFLGPSLTPWVTLLVTTLGAVCVVRWIEQPLDAWRQERARRLCSQPLNPATGN
jgi:peptidoglycan/LPS O-acetylase OafA/YrhL